MFFQPLIAEDTDSFTRAVQRVQNIYFPSGLYDARVGNEDNVAEVLDELASKRYETPFDHLGLDSREKILTKWSMNCAAKISEEKNYSCFPSQQSIRIPLTKEFHKYFLRRKYTNPPAATKAALKQYMFTMPYSATSGDFNHFANVFAAATRLINYFSEIENVDRVLDYSAPLAEVVSEDLRYHFDKKTKRISFDDDRGRVFRLLVGAFYHDVGKTIITHRHALEGAILIAFDTESFLPCFREIFSNSGAIFDRARERRFDRDDIILIEDLVHYHDVFGTLATGETGYIRLIDVVECFRRYAQKYTFDTSAARDRSEALAIQLIWSRRCLFDLWVLNMADILVSIPGLIKHRKTEDQVQQVWGIPQWRDTVTEFLFDNVHGATLRHDLMLGLNLITRHAQTIHSDDNAELAKSAREYASRHAIERIRRLVCATLIEAVAQKEADNRKEKDEIKKVEEYREREEDRLLGAVRDEVLNQWRIQSVINRVVGSCMDVAQFANDMTFVGQLDYALPFFRVLASEVVSEEQGIFTRGRQKHTDDEVARIAGKVIEDYVSVVVLIIRHLLLRELSFQRVRNIEFATARERLEPSAEKVRRLLGYHGSYKQQRAIELVLGSIFVW